MNVRGPGRKRGEGRGWWWNGSVGVGGWGGGGGEEVRSKLMCQVSCSPREVGVRKSVDTLTSWSCHVPATHTA